MSIFVPFFAQGQGYSFAKSVNGTENKYLDETNYPSYDERCHLERM